MSDEDKDQLLTLFVALGTASAFTCAMVGLLTPHPVDYVLFIVAGVIVATMLLTCWLVDHRTTLGKGSRD